jgi:hypothetical protein
MLQVLGISLVPVNFSMTKEFGRIEIVIQCRRKEKAILTRYTML